MKPIIGVTTDVDEKGSQITHLAYIQAIQKAGGVPIILPTGNDQDVDRLCGMLDGLLLTGGGDLDPSYFNEDPHPKLGEVTPERDTVELLLAAHMLKADKPILGICRGMQLLNIHFGAAVYQDLGAQYGKPLIKHNQHARSQFATHSVTIKPETKYHSIINQDNIRVNSYHHQGIKGIGGPLIIAGEASDGVVEAIESTEHAFVIGVQWHPELLTGQEAAHSTLLFQAFVKACGK